MKKRYDLSIHTNLSIYDGVSSIKDYVDCAKEHGITGLAITDRNGIFAYNEMSKIDFPFIYGTQVDFIDEELYNITLTRGKQDLSSTFIVFDLETTGITYDDEIIEIGAVKIRDYKIIDTYFTRVKPRVSISDKSTEITGITMEELVNEKYIEEIMPAFKKFIGDACLVAHNAIFDYTHIRKHLDKEYLVIDTLQLARTVYMKKTKKFNLTALCEMLEINLDNAHNALCDAKSTAELFLILLEELKKKNIAKYEEIYKAVDKYEMWKYTHPSPINILVKNSEGYKNLLEILNDGFNKHFYGDMRVIKSVLQRYRGGLLIGSGSYSGSLFHDSYEKSDAYLEQEIKFFDYIEINSMDSYLFYEEILGENYQEIIRRGQLRVIRICEKLGIPVVIASNAYYSYPNRYPQFEEVVYSKDTKRFVYLSRFSKLPRPSLKNPNDLLNEFNYLKDVSKYVYDNTELIYNMIDFSFGMDVRDKTIFNQKMKLNSLEEIINYSYNKMQNLGYLVSENKMSKQGEKQFIKIMRDVLGGNNIIIPSRYDMFNNINTKVKHIENKIVVVPNSYKDTIITPIQYEILDNQDNIKVSHLNLESYKNHVCEIDYEVNPFLSTLEVLRKKELKIELSSSLIDNSSFLSKMKFDDVINREITWYYVYRPLLFFKAYLDTNGIDDWVISEIKAQDFLIVDPSFEKSLPSEFLVKGRKLICPLNIIFNDKVARLVYESNRQWPISSIDDFSTRFSLGLATKYEVEILKLIGE